MIAVKGRYNGSVVVLDEPAPVNGEVAVVVEFPEAATPKPVVSRKFHWEESRAASAGSGVSAAEEVIRQRHME